MSPKRLKLIAAALLLMTAGRGAAFAAAPDYLPVLVEQAKAKHLQDAPEWHALLHYRKDLLGPGYTSEAVTPAFFLAAGGRSDPEAELEATLAAFFKPAPTASPDNGTQCLFIARYQWLKQQLDFDPQRLPQQPCPEFQQWYAAIDPGRLVLIFPAAYLNNPSSMFGHTFLRFDHPQQPEETHLESYAVNFAAQTVDSNGILFAYKGLTGLYPGAFNLEPYYKKVRSYSDIENRDIWEYELNYTPAEMRRILEHVWELRQVAFPYYFFSKNCSYALLALMDVARPDTPLTQHFVYQVIPSDTVKVVLSQSGVLARTVYRPSLAARLRTQLAGMSDDEQRLALAVVRQRLRPGDPAIAALPRERQASIYDAAGDYLLYLGNRGDLEKSDYGPLSLAVLRARSQLDVAQASSSTVPPDTDPATGHGSSRLDTGYGRLGSGDYSEVTWRGAYHDLLDPPSGFVSGAEINMLGLTLRHQQQDRATHLESLNLANIVSLAPRDLFFTPLSWEISVGRDRRYTGPVQRPLVNDVHGGAGYTWAAGKDSLVFAFLDASLLMNGGIPKGYAVGYGPRIGATWRPAARWNILLTAGAQRFPDHLGFTTIDYQLAQNFMLDTSWSLRLTLSRQGVIRAPQNGALLQLLYYY